MPGEKNKGNNNRTARIVCWNKRCGKKFTVIVGKNDGYSRMVKCPSCDAINHFSVDQKGKIHGPSAF